MTLLQIPSLFYQGAVWGLCLLKSFKSLSNATCKTLQESRKGKVKNLIKFYDVLLWESCRINWKSIHIIIWQDGISQAKWLKTFLDLDISRQPSSESRAFGSVAFWIFHLSLSYCPARCSRQNVFRIFSPFYHLTILLYQFRTRMANNGLCP